MKLEENYGYAGKILRVNLSSGKISTASTMKLADKFLGGRGINQWILFNEVNPGIWPLDPANRLILGTGALVGTLVPGACRLTIDGKNPLTGSVGSSNVGGHFAPELKYTGFDHVVISGRSRDPCYLWNNNDEVEIRDAGHLWGKTTWEASDLIREEKGDEVQILDIGPAGENLVRGACVICNDERAAGKGGMGAVMGSKNLKAVAVLGDGEINVAKPGRFMELVKDIWHKTLADKNMKNHSEQGVLPALESKNKISGNQVRNFQDGFWDPQKLEKINVKEFKKYAKKKLSCFACPIGASWLLAVNGGPYEGTKGEGFKANTLRNFGPKLDIDFLPAIIKIHMLCSQLGLDVDTTAGTIAWAMECYQRGILTKEDTDGLELEWGDYETVIEIIKKLPTEKNSETYSLKEVGEPQKSLELTPKNSL